MPEHDYFEKENGHERVAIVVGDEFDSRVADRIMDKLMLSTIVCGVFFMNDGVEDRVARFNPVFTLELRRNIDGLMVSYNSKGNTSILAKLFFDNLAKSIVQKKRIMKLSVEDYIPNLIIIDQEVVDEDKYAASLIATIKQHFYKIT